MDLEERKKALQEIAAVREAAKPDLRTIEGAKSDLAGCNSCIANGGQ